MNTVMPRIALGLLASSYHARSVAECVNACAPRHLTIVGNGTFATGFLHPHNRENDRRFEGENWERLQERLRSKQTVATCGLAQASAR